MPGALDAWRPASAPPALGAEAVHVWRIPLDRSAPDAGSLSADERERAARFHFAADRDRFVAARASLRRILGGYLACPPDRVGFRYAHRGKPSLDVDPPPFAFNLSHSHDLALVAVTRARALGVDVERHRPDVDLESVAASSFSVGERSALFALPPAARLDAFFRGWTRKESLVKAHGDGLYLPLDRFTVSLDDGDLVRLEAADPADVARWSIRALPIDAGYSAALTVEAPCPAISRFTAATPSGARP